jgi:hypothetical protein
VQITWRYTDAVWGRIHNQYLVIACEEVVYYFPHIHSADTDIKSTCWLTLARSETDMADRRGHLSHHRCHYWQPLHIQVHSVIADHTQMSHYVCHNTTPTSLMAGTLYTSGRALEMLAGRSVGHQTRRNRLHRPGAPSSDRHVIATRENLAEWQRSRINITHARTRKNKTIWRGSEGGSMLSRGNGLAITVWFTFPLSSHPSNLRDSSDHHGGQRAESSRPLLDGLWRRFGVTCRLHFYHCTRRNIPEDSTVRVISVRVSHSSPQNWQGGAVSQPASVGMA